MPYAEPDSPVARRSGVDRSRRWRERNPDHYADRIRARRDEGRAYLHELKARPCADCGGTFPAVCMDFDHRPGTGKVRNLAAMVALSREVIDAEVAKCDVVCANCHRVRTHERRVAART